jgi:hypothetical protein
MGKEKAAKKTDVTSTLDGFPVFNVKGIPSSSSLRVRTLVATPVEWYPSSVAKFKAEQRAYVNSGAPGTEFGYDSAITPAAVAIRERSKDRRTQFRGTSNAGWIQSMQVFGGSTAIQQLSAALNTARVAGMALTYKGMDFNFEPWFKPDATSKAKDPNSLFTSYAIKVSRIERGLSLLEMHSPFCELPAAVGEPQRRISANITPVCADWFTVTTDAALVAGYNRLVDNPDPLSTEQIRYMLMLGMLDKVTLTPIYPRLGFGELLTSYRRAVGSLINPGTVKGYAAAADHLLGNPTNTYRMEQLALQAEREVPWFTRNIVTGEAAGGVESYTYHPGLLMLNKPDADASAIKLWREHQSNERAKQEQANRGY